MLCDNEKDLITGKMREKDNATVKLHHQVMNGTSSYRYAQHPETLGPVRGPPAPFAKANKPWTPAELQPDGMAAQRDMEQAPVGAIKEGSHIFHGETLRASRSTPALTRTIAASVPHEDGLSLGEQAKLAANPISIELNRWKRMAKVTERDLMSMPELTPLKKDNSPHKKPVMTGGLVNFPKYMLFENSHLKQRDFMRFVAAEEKARTEAELRLSIAEAPSGKPSTTHTPMPSSRETLSSTDVPYAQPSWGAPRLRGPDFKNQWAGSALPSGKSIRSSNPFRMG